MVGKKKVADSNADTLRVFLTAVCASVTKKFRLSTRADMRVPRETRRRPKNGDRARFLNGSEAPTSACSRPQRFKQHQNSTKGRPREGTKKENCGGRGNKREILGLPHFGTPPFSVVSDVAVHASQRINGVEDSQWLVPGDPKSQATFCSLAQCKVACVWDHVAELHSTTGGEQGDAMMRLLFSLGQDPALQRVQSQLCEGEYLLAFLDDIYTVTTQQRGCGRRGPKPEFGFIKARPKCRTRPTLQAETVLSDPRAVVWRGAAELPMHQRDVKVLGTPLGHTECIKAQLEMLTAEHQTLRDRAPLRMFSLHGPCWSIVPRRGQITWREWWSF